MKEKIVQKFGISCFDPANGTSVFINTTHSLPVDLSINLLKQHAEHDYLQMNQAKNKLTQGNETTEPPLKKIREAIVQRSKLTPIHGVLLMKLENQQQPLRLMNPDDAIDELPLSEHLLKFTSTHPLPSNVNADTLLHNLYKGFTEYEFKLIFFNFDCSWIGGGVPIVLSRDVRSILMRSFSVTIKEQQLVSHWSYHDEQIATHAISIINKVLQ